MLPSKEWVETVGYFCMCKLYLLRTRGPLCANIRYWITKGLTLDDLRLIFRRLCDPEVARRHNYENQLMADLAGMVADTLRRKRDIEVMMRRRKAMEEPAGPDAQVIRLADHFPTPGSRSGPKNQSGRD